MPPDGNPAVMGMRLVGAGMILAASLWLSHLLCARERERLRVCTAYLALLRQIGRQIVCFNRPFSEICRLLDADLREACRLPPVGEDLAAMLEAAPPDLPPEAERIVFAFARELGRCYRDEQIAACDAAVAALEAETSAERRRLGERVRLIRCICLCGGLTAVILLI